MVLTIPVAPNGVAYVGRDIEESLPWGPTSFTVGPQRTVWVADAPRRRVLVYDGNTGEAIEVIDLSDNVERITSLAVNEQALYVLDVGAQTRVLQIMLDQRSITAYEMPPSITLETGLNGISLDARGAVVAELRGGAERYQLFDPQGLFGVNERLGYEVAGHSVRVIPGDPSGISPGVGSILVDGLQVASISLPSNLIGMSVIGSWADGTFAVRLHEVAAVGGVLEVDETVRKYNLDGEFIGEARIDLDREVVPVDQRLAVGENGEIFQMATRDDHVAIVALSFAESPLGRTLPPSPLEIGPNRPSEGPIPRAQCVTGKQMLDLAEAYASHKQYYSEINVNGECSQRTVPGWLSVGEHVGVAYDWGGFDSLESYTAELAGGAQAGDINVYKPGNVECSRGVDCSGFVSRLWQLPGKKGTSTLLEVSKAIDKEAMLVGDVFNKPGSHVVMLASPDVGQDAVQIAESAAGGIGRVVIRSVGWDYLNNYGFRRSNNHCGYFDDAEPCVTGGFTAPAQVDGDQLLLKASFAAPEGLLRYSIVTDGENISSYDYPMPAPTQDTIDIAVDISELDPGEHTIGLWVKDVYHCTNGAAVDATVIEVTDDGGECVPESDSACMADDVYWLDSCGQAGLLKEDCGYDSPIGGSYCMGGDVYLDYQDAGCTNGQCTSEVTPKLEQSCGGDGCSQGSCNGCQNNDYAQCLGGDVHWFDSCDVPTSVKEDCGNDSYVGGDYCMGGDVYRDYETVGCSGSKCTSDVDPKLQESCGGDGCSNGSCLQCEDFFDVTSYECSSYTNANGLENEVIEVCGTTNAQTGYMTVKARKWDGSTFGTRPYQVRVSALGDDPCGPDSYNFVVSDSNPTGVGSKQLTFTFQSIWLQGQTDKAYCVTASTTPNDPGYDPNDPKQESWWWSDKLALKKSCQ